MFLTTASADFNWKCHLTVIKDCTREKFSQLASQNKAPKPGWLTVIFFTQNWVIWRTHEYSWKTVGSHFNVRIERSDVCTSNSGRNIFQHRQSNRPIKALSCGGNFSEALPKLMQAFLLHFDHDHHCS